MPGHKVLLKINLNTASPYPASTCPKMLRSLLDLFHSKGIHEIVIGDCSSVRGALPTRRVAKKTGILKAIEGRAEASFFDEEKWVTIPIGGQYLREVTVPRIALEVDRIIAVANMKTHKLADFSFGMKLAVGFMHPRERYNLHNEHLQEKAVEILKAIQPDLTIIDGRSVFISGGPDSGKVVEGGVLLLGDNPLAVDLEAYAITYLLKKQHGYLETFAEDPFAMRQFRHGIKLDLGGTTWEGYSCVQL
jgi:uncharacterized protein (DUF362 family)